jgi:DNA-binding FrmR family transcriptional regulator
MISVENKVSMRNRLARIEGQIRGIQKLVDVPEPDCDQIVQQMSAARKALDKTSHTMLACMIEEHMRSGSNQHNADLAKLIAKYA